MTRDPRPLRERLADPAATTGWRCKLCGQPTPGGRYYCEPCLAVERKAFKSPKTVKRATLLGEILDSHQTETELNGFRESQGRML